MHGEQEKANLRLVERVYEEVLGPIDNNAVDALFLESYIQHNPSIPSGRDALKEMLERAKIRVPHAEHRVKRMIADGDMVAAHVHLIFEPGTPGLAVVDLFRIEDGKIAEHWDVAQPVSTEPKNDNGMF
ncbi:MAG: nuclear transport factor 2 family protein [Sphingobium sp.]|nr:nuclear transport factor 2 family protein [Sphingobium sp.]